MVVHGDVVRAHTEAVIAHAMAANMAFQQAEAREKFHAMWQPSTGAPQRNKPIRPVDDGLGDDAASEEDCAREKVCHSYPPDMSRRLRQLNARRRELASRTEREAREVLAHSATVQNLSAELTNAKSKLDASRSAYDATKRELKKVLDEYSALVVSGIRDARLLDSSDDSACKSSSDEDDDLPTNGLEDFKEGGKDVPYRDLKGVLPAPP